MRMYLNRSLSYHDDKVRTNEMPLRTEVLEFVFEDVAEHLGYLRSALEDQGFQPTEVHREAKHIATMVSGLNSNETHFLSWMTEDTLSGRTGYYAPMDCKGVIAVEEVVKCGNLPVIKTCVNRWCTCLNRSFFNHCDMLSFVQDEDWNENTPLTGDETYNHGLKLYVEFCVQQYATIRNLRIDANNRRVVRDHTCEKCGTVFQRTRSKNIHYSKCNGVNRGYLEFHERTAVEKVSEW